MRCLALSGKQRRMDARARVCTEPCLSSTDKNAIRRKPSMLSARKEMVLQG